MGGSVSTNISEQDAEAYIAQQFSSSCDITCQNLMSGVNIDLINSNVGGGIELTQTCTTNANCVSNNSMDATSDITFKGLQSSNAKQAWSVWSGNPFSFEIAVNESRQSMKESLLQNSNQRCNVSSLNQMNDISIYAQNSNIGGAIKLSQSGDVSSGSCQMGNIMSAAAKATGISKQTASSGKDKKAQSGIGTVAIIIIIIAVIVVIFIVSKVIIGNAKSSKFQKEMSIATSARVKAGCPGGAKPIRGPGGKAVIDPRNNLPVCPPYPEMEKLARKILR